MGVSVYVMPLSTYVAGNFRTSWGPDGDGGAPPRTGLPPDEARRSVERFREQLYRLIPRLPEWDESGPARSATTFSHEGFALPFERARRWATRVKLPCLQTLEPPQIWLPADFEPVFRVAAPWDAESKVQVASGDRFQAELGRLLLLLDAEEQPQREEAGRVARTLSGIAAVAREHGLPVIVEG